MSDLVQRIRDRPNDAPMPTERLLDEAADRIKELEGMVYSLRACLQPLAHQLLNYTSDQIDPQWMFLVVRDAEDADLIGQDVLNARRCLDQCVVKKPSE